MRAKRAETSTRDVAESVAVGISFRAAGQHLLVNIHNIGVLSAAALSHHFAQTPQTPLLIVGTDCPALTPEHLQQAADALQTVDGVLIPAEDGGYVLNADIDLELNPRLVDAISRGVSLYFTTELRIERPRWYWLNATVRTPAAFRVRAAAA